MWFAQGHRDRKAQSGGVSAAPRTPTPALSLLPWRGFARDWFRASREEHGDPKPLARKAEGQHHCVCPQPGVFTERINYLNLRCQGVCRFRAFPRQYAKWRCEWPSIIIILKFNKHLANTFFVSGNMPGAEKALLYLILSTPLFEGDTRGHTLR